MPASLANHLLQLTIFAALAGLLTLLLRNNHARTRYWLWFAASMKFLIPFEWFVKLGHSLSPSVPPVAANAQLVFVMQEISQPFAAPAVQSAAPPTASIFPSVLLAIWVGGAAVVLITWIVRWRRVAASLCASTPLVEGREFESVQRLTGHSKRGRTELLSSTTSIEPGVFGILRPVLSLPAGIASRLDDEQLDAIIAHELCHLRRRDNLTAALHMLVEAVFWFHPLVWWIGARLVEERERACDEEVVRIGGDPEVYAESILKICRYYLASPLPCAAGISGSDLKKRIEIIMSNTSLTALSATKKIILSVAGLLAILTPLAIGAYNAPNKPKASVQAPVPIPAPIVPATQPQLIAQAAPPAAVPQPAPLPVLDPHLTFEAASIKLSPPSGAGSRFGCSGGPLQPGTKDPERVSCTNISALYLITQAWNVQSYQMVASAYENFPAVYVNATMAPGTTKDQYRIMLKNLLAERFKLALHSEKKEMAVYELVIGKNGTKATIHNDPASDDAPAPMNADDIKKGPDGFPTLPPNRTILAIYGNGGRYQISGETIETAASMFSHYVDRPVIDKTGLAGKYDFSIYWIPTAPGTIPSPDSPGPSFQQAIEQQLGFRLVPMKDPVHVLVVDHLEKTPTEN